MPPLRAALFDLDGTLLDSLASQYTVFARVFDVLGKRFDEAAYRAHYSPNWYLLYERLGLPRAQWPEADRLWLEHYARAAPPPMPGAEEVIAAARSAGLTVAVVTSGDRSRVGWQATFDIVVCGSDLAERKPKPGPLLHALAQVSVAPAEAIYVGDTVDDVEMGKAAGTLTAGVATGFSPWEALAAAAPTYLCRSLREVAPVLLGRPDAGGQEA